MKKPNLSNNSVRRRLAAREAERTRLIARLANGWRPMANQIIALPQTEG